MRPLILFNFFVVLLILTMGSLFTGCGLLFNSEQKVDNKSHDYTVVRLDRIIPAEWHLLHAGVGDKKEAEEADLAFEHPKTGAIISLNSVCREYREASLEDLSKFLLLGLNTQGTVTTKDIQVDGVKGLESTVEAFLVPNRSNASENHKPSEVPVRVQVVVIRKEGCTYDFMYIAKPAVFDHIATTFDRFLKGFHVK